MDYYGSHARRRNSQSKLEPPTAKRIKRGHHTSSPQMPAAVEGNDKEQAEQQPKDLRRQFAIRPTQNHAPLQTITTLPVSAKEELGELQRSNRNLHEQVSEQDTRICKLESEVASLMSTIRKLTGDVGNITKEGQELVEKVDGMAERVRSISTHAQASQDSSQSGARGKDKHRAPIDVDALMTALGAGDTREPISFRKTAPKTTATLAPITQKTLLVKREARQDDTIVAPSFTSTDLTQTKSHQGTFGLMPGSHAVFGLNVQDFTAPALTNAAFTKLLQRIDFTDINQIKSLVNLDPSRQARESTLFCDSVTFPKFDVDYTLRSGGHSCYFADHSGFLQHDARIASIKAQGLPWERFAELNLIGGTKVSSRSPNSQHQAATQALEEYQDRENFPRYVYDLGQLIMRRRGKSRTGQTKMESIDTHANVVMDIVHPSKAIWVVLRPGAPGETKANKNESVYPQFRMGGSVTAKLIKRIENLILGDKAFDGETSPEFLRASNTTFRTRADESFQLEYATPSFWDMRNKIAHGWSKQPANRDR
ncbi:hypothetical protein F5Y15DRAFT_417636 [Xylariaceae sp. FL0016]|nr:hypothetical protein F5Y15DRAFT_417636 [Xylariaceae sp. FL0016]